MSTIQVDLDGLALLATRLAEVRARLAADAGCGLTGHCRDPLVAAALDDVQEDWSRKRRRHLRLPGRRQLGCPPSRRRILDRGVRGRSSCSYREREMRLAGEAAGPTVGQPGTGGGDVCGHCVTGG